MFVLCWAMSDSVVSYRTDTSLICRYCYKQRLFKHALIGNAPVSSHQVMNHHIEVQNHQQCWSSWCETMLSLWRQAQLSLSQLSCHVWILQFQKSLKAFRASAGSGKGSSESVIDSAYWSKLLVSSALLTCGTMGAARCSARQQQAGWWP